MTLMTFPLGRLVATPGILEARVAAERLPAALGLRDSARREAVDHHEERPQRLKGAGHGPLVLEMPKQAA
jgi:hypothetical protein